MEQRISCPAFKQIMSFKQFFKNSPTIAFLLMASLRRTRINELKPIRSVVKFVI
jgi:hypothetical protein